jgi:hypothetical protein
MTTDATEAQDDPQRRRALEMSLTRGQPPTQVPGYDPERFLGVGAYGEVWVAIERNTGRRVAIKFYAHRGGLDWSFLSREVEKLAFLFADRYVVQLLAVGWDAEPPYYVMEYLPRGSLADRLRHGPLGVDEALAIFQDVARGLVHAHGKGVLHCDLKPANILLDEDQKPRLADFGQSRLSHEQLPALGTMFYMAPEQADLEAMPDVRWDVYALGAVLYCMLTGHPPHGTLPEAPPAADLAARLAGYRQMIEGGPPPAAHWHVPGVDRSLAELIDRCLAANPEQRFPNVQAVLAALELRAVRRSRRPLMVLGAVGPLLLLAVVSWFAWRGFGTAVGETNEALIARALDSNRFAAQNVARTAATEVERRYQAVERVAASSRFRQTLVETLAKPRMRELLQRLSDPNLAPAEQDRLRGEFLALPERRALQQEFAAAVATVKRWDRSGPSSWFFCDPLGVSTVRVPEGRTIGKDFAWRSYFHGKPLDYAESWRPRSAGAMHVEKTQLSAVFRSQATTRWTVAVSTPVFEDGPEKRFLGVIAQTAEVGRFVEFSGGDHQFAVLVDDRAGPHQGLIVEHPLFDALMAREGKLPDRFTSCRVSDDDLPNTARRQRHYQDPLAADPDGRAYDRRWLAWTEPVRLRGADSGWLVIVQEAYDVAIGSTLDRLKSDLVRYGLSALAMIGLVMAGLWVFVARLTSQRMSQREI